MNDLPRPTIADVARAAGVSRTTVSHALSGQGKVSPRTRELVRRVAAEVGYRPSPRARALRGGRSHVLGVVSSMSPAIAGGTARLGFFMEVAAAAAERALTYGYALVLVPPLGPEPSVALQSIAMDGLIVVEPAGDDPLVEHARAERIPFVALGRPSGAQRGELWVDLHAGDVAELLVRHLAEQGASHPVLMVGDKPRPSYRAAVRRYRAVAAELGWDAHVEHVEESLGEQGAREAIRSLMDARPQTDAVLALVDAFASGVVQGLHDLGLDIPGDVAVATRYDGVRARTSRPLLTAVDLHLPAAASRAVDLLVTELGSEPPPEGMPAAPPVGLPTLVPRASSVRREEDQHA